MPAEVSTAGEVHAPSTGVASVNATHPSRGSRSYPRTRSRHCRCVMGHGSQMPVYTHRHVSAGSASLVVSTQNCRRTARHAVGSQIKAVYSVSC